MTQWSKPLTKFAACAKDIALTRASPCISARNYNVKAVPILGYKPQLSLPPDRIGLIERPIALHVMHFATNALDDASLFTLDAFGGPAVKSVRAMALAVLARTARKTLPMWTSSVQQLRDARGDHSSLKSLVDGKCWDAFWDSPPIAITLECAARHFASDAVDLLCLPPSSFLRRRRADIERASRAADRALSCSPNLNVQKTFYTEFLKVLYGGELQTRIFAKRLSEAFAPLCNPLPIIDWEPASAMLRAVPIHAAIMVIKTWANSWTTSARFHDGKLTYCCLGCPGELDCIEHYMVCPPLWRTVTDTTDIARAENILERICISCPSRSNLLNLIVASGTYHTIKLQYCDKVLAAQKDGEWQSIFDLALSAAVAVYRAWSTIVPRACRQVGVATSLVPDARSPPEDYCEPECNDMPPGTHHPSCVMYLLARETDGANAPNL